MEPCIASYPYIDIATNAAVVVMSIASREGGRVEKVREGVS